MAAQVRVKDDLHVLPILTKGLPFEEFDLSKAPEADSGGQLKATINRPPWMTQELYADDQLWESVSTFRENRCGSGEQRIYLLL